MAMDDDYVLMYLQQMAGQTPVLLVYLVAMILALVFWRRCPGPCALTLVSIGLLLVTTLAQPVVFLYLNRVGHIQLGWPHERFGWAMAATALVGSVIRAAAFSLLLTAVFIGRKRVPPTAPSRALPPTAPAPERSEEHGITTRPGG
jgi:hypothetical protein